MNQTFEITDTELLFMLVICSIAGGVVGLVLGFLIGKKDGL